MDALLQERLDLNPTRDAARTVRWEEVYELSAGALQEEIEVCAGLEGQLRVC